MMNLNDTISAFRCCVQIPPDCANCPEQGPGFGIECRKDVKASVFLWLKAQEPRVMTLGEVMALEEGTGDVWIEDAPIPGRVPCISATTMMDKSTLDSDGEVEFFDCSIYAITDYNANRANGWRCWTSRPTDEQRETTAWNGQA